MKLSFVAGSIYSLSFVKNESYKLFIGSESCANATVDHESSLGELICSGFRSCEQSDLKMNNLIVCSGLFSCSESEMRSLTVRCSAAASCSYAQITAEIA